MRNSCSQKENRFIKKNQKEEFTRIKGTVPLTTRLKQGDIFIRGGYCITFPEVMAQNPSARALFASSPPPYLSPCGKEAAG
jgi:hypothetical protein